VPAKAWGIMNASQLQRGLIAAAIVGILATAGLLGRHAFAQEPTPPAKDYYQRSLEIYEFRKAARSGPERGREIYYYKCWFCHNEFVKDIPRLDGLYRKPNLLSGAPVNDATVKDKLRNGGPTMPGYQYALSDADLDDLVSYLREACCWDSDTPPLNPRYRGN
jgi:mono/diheme cytochrome c family protein